MDKKKDIIDTLVSEQFDGALKQWHSENRRHWLRNVHPERFGETGAFASG
jgi:hypothetical protein